MQNTNYELRPPVAVTGVFSRCISGFWVSHITNSSERCDLNAGRLRVRMRGQKVTTFLIRNKGTTGNTTYNGKLSCQRRVLFKRMQES